MNDNRQRKALAIIDTVETQIDFVSHQTQEAWRKAVKRNLGMLRETLPPVDAESPPKTLTEVREYLEEAIASWRAHRDAMIVDDSAEDGRRQDLKQMAPYYVDAFQSVHVFFFGETVPGKDKIDGLEEL